MPWSISGYFATSYLLFNVVGSLTVKLVTLLSTDIYCIVEAN